MGNRTRLALIVVLALAGCNDGGAPPPAASTSDRQPLSVFPTTSTATPWTSLDFANDPNDFQFAIIADRTGGHRPDVFEDGIGKVNLLRPEFVMSVGDLIEGYTEDGKEIRQQWTEFEGLIKPLEMPFFHVPGNHDITNPVQRQHWDERFGRSFYHFIYRDVLFLCINSEDGELARMSDEQIEYFRQVLAEHPNVRWTLAFLHEPLWVYEDQAKDENSADIGKTNWLRFEEFLQGRNYTVFAGHFHNYTRYDRLGQRYFILATMGGSSQIPGPAFGAFDHFVWVTMSDHGPIVANLWLDGVLDQDVVTEGMGRQIEAMLAAGRITAPALLTQESTFGSATVQLRVTNDSDYPMTARGRFGPNATLRPEPYAIDRVVAPKSVEVVEVTIAAAPGTQVSALKPLRLDWDLSFAIPNRPAAELQSITMLSVQHVTESPAATAAITIDGRLDEWQETAFAAPVTSPVQILKSATDWTGPEDASFRIATAHDDRYLYLAIDVRDELVRSEAGRMAWEQDGVEVRLDARAEAVRARETGDGEYSGGFMTVVLSPGQNQDTPGAYLKAHWPDGLKAICAPVSGGYAAEIAVPVAYLDQKQGQPWSAIRLNLAVDDADGPAEPAQLWLQPDWRSQENIPGSGTILRRSGPAEAPTRQPAP